MPHTLMVPLITPVTADASVSEAGVVAVIGSVAPHVDGLVPALSTGEGWALSFDQWYDMVHHTVRHAGNLPVLAGILCATTASVMDRARSAGALGVRAVVVSTPFGPDISQEQMYRHYADVAAASPVPVVVYHESAVSGNELDLDTLWRVCQLPTVVAVKDSGGNADLTRRLLDAGPGVPVWQGREDLLGADIPVDGYVLSLANLEPGLCAELARSPSRDTAARVTAACAEYGLLRDDWYLAIKTRLRHDRVIADDRRVAETLRGEG